MEYQSISWLQEHHSLRFVMQLRPSSLFYKVAFRLHVLNWLMKHPCNKQINIMTQTIKKNLRCSWNFTVMRMDGNKTSNLWSPWSMNIIVKRFNLKKITPPEINYGKLAIT